MYYFMAIDGDLREGNEKGVYALLDHDKDLYEF